jgi:hypothetical protein
MFHDDDSARRALRTITDDPAPPLTTTLDQVVRRGRRRVLVQRTGMVAGVMGVVAAIGVGAILLRPGDGVQTATTVTMSAPSTPALPGWEPVSLPASVRGIDGVCKQDGIASLPPAPNIPLLPAHVVRDALATAAQRTGMTMQLASSVWEPDSPKNAGPRGNLDFKIVMDNGQGRLQLEASRFGGTPTQVADASITVYGNCDTPMRLTRPDGTVLQLYPLDDRDRAAPSQRVQIYQPDGRMYVITSAAKTEENHQPPTVDHPQTVDGGKVPVTEAQLAEFGTVFVANLR